MEAQDQGATNNFLDKLVLLNNVIAFLRRALKGGSHSEIATAIFLIATNGWYRIQSKCPQGAIATTAPMQPIVSKSKSQSPVALCE